MKLSFLRSKWSNVSNFMFNKYITNNNHILCILSYSLILFIFTVISVLTIFFHWTVKFDFSLLYLSGNTKLSRIISTTAKGWNGGEPSSPEAHFGIGIHSGCSKRVLWEYHRWLLKKNPLVKTVFHLPQILNGAVF